MTKRLSILPVVDHESWYFYKKHSSLYWSPEEISFSEDRVVFDRLTKKEQKIILNILAFFSFADTLVNNNIQKWFLANPENSMEVDAFYTFQSMIELVHSEVYSLQIMELVSDPEERMDLFNSVEKYPNVKMKTDWINEHIENANLTYVQRLLCFVLIEGLFFSCSFSTIYYFKKKGILLNGLIYSNELISRDEFLHQSFGTMLFNRFNKKNKMSLESVHKIVGEANEIEKQFARDVLYDALPGLNVELMSTYINFLTNQILESIGYPPLFPPSENKNPFDFMAVSYEIETKSNFFEKKESAYQRGFGAGYSNKIDFSKV